MDSRHGRKIDETETARRAAPLPGEERNAQRNAPKNASRTLRAKYRKMLIIALAQRTQRDASQRRIPKGIFSGCKVCAQTVPPPLIANSIYAVEHPYSTPRGLLQKEQHKTLTAKYERHQQNAPTLPFPRPAKSGLNPTFWPR